MVKVDLAKTYTVEEYLTLEAKSESRHEFYSGKIFEMPGNTILHNQICINLWMNFRNQLPRDAYSIGTETVKVKIKGENIFLYPDVFICKIIAYPETTIVINDPVLIAEVMSDSSRRYDCTDKFIQYRKIDSLIYYLMIEPEKQVVFFYEKTADGDWIAKTYTENEEVVKFPLLNATIGIGDIYCM